VDWLKSRVLGKKRITKNSGTKTCGDYSNNRRRGVQDIALGNRTTN
jgi:hypothetical protein